MGYLSTRFIFWDIKIYGVILFRCRYTHLTALLLIKSSILLYLQLIGNDPISVFNYILVQQHFRYL